MLAASALVTSSSSAVRDDSIRIRPCSIPMSVKLSRTSGRLKQDAVAAQMHKKNADWGNILLHPQYAVQSPLHVVPAPTKLPVRLKVRCSLESGIEQQPPGLRQCAPVTTTALDALSMRGATSVNARPLTGTPLCCQSRNGSCTPQASC